VVQAHIFDGENTPQNIAAYGFLLGALFGGSVVFAVYGGRFPQLTVYLAAIAVFHTMEYIATALFNANKLTLDSFLINHSPAYIGAHAAALSEFLLEYLLFPSYKRWTLISNFGFAAIVFGQLLRTAAMFHAKSNFSHHVADRHEAQHVLVTTGVYAWCRHPSYVGFYFWATGCQVLLANPVCFFGFLYVLWNFFNDRIEYEERMLVHFFGNEYEEYRKRVGTWLPFIR